MRRLLPLIGLLVLSSCMPAPSSVPSTITVTSSAFKNGGAIPAKYTCDGLNVSPPLTIGNVPKEARSLALLLIDPDVPVSGGFMHWAVWSIPASATDWPEGTVPKGAIQAVNNASSDGYTGPCPPSGTHHYVFTVYAYGDKAPEMPPDSSRSTIESNLKANAIARGILTGTYISQPSGPDATSAGTR